ncbi:MAG: sigma-70 family RNA polymerase sigma factor [Phycisphaerae bacterium]|nr:sigma-70 family RNA polymerase sigma factor [Phycisphaerae bacterium]MBT7454060.1 sigma-70 family RNA polymerase sigma factor [Gemmatimonadota bacterium]
MELHTGTVWGDRPAAVVGSMMNQQVSGMVHQESTGEWNGPPRQVDAVTAGHSEADFPDPVSEGSTDTELLKAAAQGAEEAWEILVRRYDRLVYSVPIRAGVCAADAAGITQDVFVSLFEQMDRLRDPQALAAWLLTTTHRQTWAHHRRRKHLSATFDEDAQGSWPPPAEKLERLESQHNIRLAMAELGDPCRSLLEALFFHHTRSDYASVAKRLGISIGTIGPARARCFEQLRPILGRYGVMDAGSDHS